MARYGSGALRISPMRRRLDKVLTNDDGRFALVISSGTGYLIDIEKRCLIYQSKGYPPIESAINTGQPYYFIAGTFVSILVLDHTGLIKEIAFEFSTYGIYFTGQAGDRAIGDISSYLYGDINVGFNLDLSTFEVSIDKTVKVKRLGPLEYITVSDSKAKSFSLVSKLWKYLSD